MGREPAADTATAAEERRDVRAAGFAVLLLLGTTLVGPWLVHRLAEHPDPDGLRGLVPGEVAVIELGAAPKVLLSNRGETHPGVPTLRGFQAQRLLQLGDFGDAGELLSRPFPFALLSAFDYVAHRQRLLIAPPRLLRERARFLQLRIDSPPESPFAEAEEWAPLRAPVARP